MTKFLEMDIQRFASGLDFPTTFTIHCYGETSRFCRCSRFFEFYEW